MLADTLYNVSGSAHIRLLASKLTFIVLLKYTVYAISQDMAPPLPRRKLLPLHQLFKTKSTNLAQLHGYFMRLGDTSTAAVDV